jgi:hypothetical protein
MTAIVSQQRTNEEDKGCNVDREKEIHEKFSIAAAQGLIRLLR